MQDFLQESNGVRTNCLRLMPLAVHSEVRPPQVSAAVRRYRRRATRVPPPSSAEYSSRETRGAGTTPVRTSR